MVSIKDERDSFFNRVLKQGIDAMHWRVGRYGDLVRTLGSSRERLCGIFNTVLQFVHGRFKHLLTWDHVQLDNNVLSGFAEAVTDKGAPLTCCVGFIDGTVRQILRPGKGLQKVFYNGHKVIMLKYCLVCK